ncbi:ATP-binding protein [uncultured Shimia sp.]|uniref:ATP-binding protein n=1 Tax=uncultured Shimia sp. TaxID=573152 RepID=UPI002618F37E|nr:ATP-binding protein [uncultured Shimia sp.]
MPQEKKCFSVRFPGSPRGVRRALLIIRAEIKSAEVDNDLLGRAETVLAEVLNNVVEHALDDKHPGLVEAKGEAVKTGWQFSVIDNGCPLPDGKIPGKALPRINTPLQDLPEGGFGWAMVHMLARDLTYQRRSGRNSLSFLIPFH